MASKKQTFEEREKAAGLFGTMSGREQRDNRGTYSQINSAQANYKNALENSLGGRFTQSQVEKAQRHADSMGMDFDPRVGYMPEGYGKTPSLTSAQRRESRNERSRKTGNPISKGGAAGLAAFLSGRSEEEQMQIMGMLFGKRLPSDSFRMRAERQDQSLYNQINKRDRALDNQVNKRDRALRGNQGQLLQGLFGNSSLANAGSQEQTLANLINNQMNFIGNQNPYQTVL